MPSPTRERRLTTFYILALSLIAGLSLTGQILIQRQLSQQLSDGRVVNIAGRQRMLSQQLSKLALRFGPMNIAEWPITAIGKTLTSLELQRAALVAGDQELGLPPLSDPSALQIMQRSVQEYEALTRSVRLLIKEAESAAEWNPRIETAIAAIQQHEEPFLAQMELLVFELDRESQQRVDRLRFLELVLFGITLAVLVCEGLLIFRPAVNRIRTTVQELQATTAELQLAKEHAESASFAKSRFLAVMSHEIRTPLHAVLGLTELTLQTELNDKQRDYLTLVQDSGLTLLAQLNDALDFAKIEANRIELEELPFSLRAELQLALKPLAIQAERKGLRFQWQVDRDVPDRLIGDWTRIRQVLLNLGSNAVKFTASGEILIQIALNRDEEQSMLHGEVRDTGIGLTPQQQTSIFTPFTQADSSTTREYGGTGLGLTIAQQLVSLMKGGMGLQSKPGLGSCFWFELPLRCAPFAEQQSHPIETISTEQELAPALKLLVLDDQLANQIIMRELLTTRGHQVDCVSRPSEFLAAVKHESYDLLLTDLHLPEMDGWETIRQYRAWEKLQHIAPKPVVAITASCLPGDQQKCTAAGIDELLVKPLQPASLERVIGKYFAFKNPAVAADARIQQPAAASPELPGWNVAVAIQRLDGKPKLWVQLAELLQSQEPTLQQELQAAISQQDQQAIVRIAHRLNGSFSQLGAEQAVEQLVPWEVEQHDAAQDGTQLKLLFTKTFFELTHIHQLLVTGNFT